MFHLMKVEWQKVRLPVVCTALVLTAAALLLTCTRYREYMLRYDLEAWEIGTELFSFIFPLPVTLPLCWNLYQERKNHFLAYVLPRVPIKKYLAAKWLVYALGAFLILFLPHVLAGAAALYVKPAVEPLLYDQEKFRHVFADVFVEMPMCYAFVLSLWKGVIGVLMMTFGFVLALFADNAFVILTGPFIYSVLENFTLAVLRLERYRLVVSFEPSCVAADAVNLASMLSGPLLLMSVTALTLVCFRWIKKTAVVSI